MRLATIASEGPDGRLVVVAADGVRYAPATEIAQSLQQALESWSDAEPKLRDLASRLEAGEASERFSLGAENVLAPIPRAWQWLDGSVFPSHAELMDKALGIEGFKTGRPLMYQGISDMFFGPTDDVPMPDEDLGIDFEGEFGVIVDEVPMGVSPQEAMEHIRLLVQINDWSLRKLAGDEMKSGFGWIQAKPPCSMAPLAITPDELGDNWRNGRICLDLLVDWNGLRFGAANGEPMEYGFHELVAHAARTRRLVAGTVIGSGTVSNSTYRDVGSSCIAERRGIEMLDAGEPQTDFMKLGDTVRMQAVTKDGRAPFGMIEQRVVEA